MVSPQGKRQCESSDLNLDWIDCYIARTHVRTVRKKVGSKCLFFSSFRWIPLFVLSLIIMDDVFFYTFSSTEGLCALFTFVKAFTTVGEQVMSWCWFCSRWIFTLCALVCFISTVCNKVKTQYSFCFFPLLLYIISQKKLSCCVKQNLDFPIQF